MSARRAPRRALRRALALGLALATSAGCYGSLATDNPLTPIADTPEVDAGPLSFQSDIAPLFDIACLGCHSGAAAAAGYDTTSYQAVLAGGADGTPNVIPGDATSKLVTYLAPASGAPHQNLEASFPGLGQTVQDWVVLYAAQETIAP